MWNVSDTNLLDVACISTFYFILLFSFYMEVWYFLISFYFILLYLMSGTIRLTLRLLMSYIYGAPSKARNANVVYIWTYVWQR